MVDDVIVGPSNYIALYRGVDTASDSYLTQLSVLDGNSAPFVQYDSVARVFQFLGLRTSSIVYYNILSTLSPTSSWGAANWPTVSFNDCSEVGYTNITPTTTSNIWGRSGIASLFTSTSQLVVTRFPTHTAPLSSTVYFVIQY